MGHNSLGDSDETQVSYPLFDLSYDVDDPADPSEVTVYADGTSTTQWISIDIDHAIALEDVA